MLFSKSAIEQYQWAVAYVCLAGLALIFCGSVMYYISSIWEKIKARWRQLDGLSKFMVCSSLTVAVMYGGSKPMYNDPPKVGADEGISLWFVDVKYDTNTMHSTIMVVWTNEFDAASINTPLAYRESSSNDWNIIDYPLDARVYKSGISNILEFTESSTTNDYSKFTHWWFGIDLPGVEIIVTSDDLKLDELEHTSEYLDVHIIVSEKLAAIIEAIEALGEESHFTIQFSDDKGKTWVSCAETKQQYTRIPGFWYGKDRIWRVVYVYQIGGEEEK